MNALAQNRRNSLPCTVRTSQTKVVPSKGWLSDGRMDALHCNHKWSMFQGAWRDLEPDATNKEADYLMTFYLPINYQKERGQRAVYYTSPQSFIIRLSYSLA